MINMKTSQWQKEFNAVYGFNLEGKNRITSHYLANDPFNIVKTSDTNNIKTVRIYLDCGDDDFLYKGNSNFHILLKYLNIPHE